MILGTPSASPYETTVRSGCTTAFQGTIAHVREVIQATAVLLDTVAQAAPVIRQVVQDRLFELAAVQAEIKAHSDAAPAQDVAHVVPQLCALAVTADKLGTQFSSLPGVDYAHRNFLDTMDILRAPLFEQDAPKRDSRYGIVMIAGGALVLLVGAATLLSPRRI
jgi:hypothetical protein